MWDSDLSFNVFVWLWVMFYQNIDEMNLKSKKRGPRRIGMKKEENIECKKEIEALKA